MKSLALAAGALMLCAASGAPAQKVYRCGPEGRIYQQAPCAEGQAVDVSDPRTAEQRQQAQAAAQSDAKAAAKFDRDMTGTPPAQDSKARAAPAPKNKAASSPKTGPKKTDTPPKPPVYLSPLPKGPASAAAK